LCDALEYLHNQQPPILHRDIKPSNIRITPSGLIKLVDFGLVKVMVPDEMTITVVQGRGTALYTPLEQYGGDTGHTNVRSDIYALGCTLYHLWTGQAPTEAKQRFLNPDTLLPPRRINPKITPETERAILWAMALHPDDRPADIRQLRDALLGPDAPTPSPVSIARTTKPLPIKPAESPAWPYTERILAGAAAALFLFAVVFSLTS
jgi:serine/threonine-protein kinase